jgi:hypothetical protein
MRALIRLVVAVSALTGSAAHALTPTEIDNLRGNGLKEINLAGSSSQRLFVAAWFQQQCKASTFDVFFNGTGDAPSGSGYRAYSCRLQKPVGNFAIDTPVLLVKRDTGGSFEGVNPIALAAPQTHMLVDGSCTATANPSPATDILAPSFACPSTQNVISDAGLSDVEPVLMQDPINLPSPAMPLKTWQLNLLDIKTVVQAIYGVVVNKKAYLSLQKSQGLVPLTATQIDESLANTPTLQQTFVTAALLGGLSGSTADKLGWNREIDATVDPGVLSRQINICRGTVGGSGAQPVVGVFAANNGQNAPRSLPFGQTLNAQGTASIGANVGTLQATGTLAVQLGSGATNVEACLGTTIENAAGTAYGLGVLARENAPLSQSGALPDKGYRFVRLDGVLPNRDVAKIGRYPLVFNATMQWNEDTITNGSDKEAFLNSLRSNAGKPASLNGADLDTQQGSMSPPSTYSGPYDDLTDPLVLKFSSRVDRLNNNSRTALRIVK